MSAEKKIPGGENLTPESSGKGKLPPEFLSSNTDKALGDVRARVDGLIQEKSVSEQIEGKREMMDGMYDSLRELLEKDTGDYVEKMKVLLNGAEVSLPGALQLAEEEQAYLNSVANKIREDLDFSFDVREEDDLEAAVICEMNQQRMKEFLGKFGHDFANSPFNAKVGFLRLMIEDEEMAKDDEFMVPVKSTVESFPELLNSVLLLGKKAEFTEQKDGDLLGGYRESLKNVADGKGVKLNFNIPEGLKYHTDGARLDAILRNFLNNAIKFSPENSEVNVNVTNEGEMLKFSVVDQGEGVNEGVLATFKELFEPETDPEQIQVTSHEGTKGEAGTGMGIISTRSSADDIFGRLGVESVPGEGSTFSVSIPANQEALLGKIFEQDEILAAEVAVEVGNRKKAMRKEERAVFAEMNVILSTEKAMIVSKSSNPKTFALAKKLSDYVVSQGHVMTDEKFVPEELREDLNAAAGLELYQGYESPETLPTLLKGLEVKIDSFIQLRN